ncbi:MAG: hypothetical protein M9962_00990 [Oligoflexia bacterium]|nr:hypothetical protein [Oligoflexia bacterium]
MLIRHVATTIFLALVSILVFSAGFLEKKEIFGHPGSATDLSWRINTENSVTYLLHWKRMGIFSLKFSLAQNQFFETPESQEKYFSYPSGFMIPLYIISSIFKPKIDYRLVDSYTMLIHYLLSLVLASLAFLILKDRSVYLSLFAFVSVQIFTVFYPPIYLFFSTTFFADLASALPYSIFILLLFWQSIKPSHTIERLTLLALFWGLCTDWSFYFILFFYILFLWIFQENRKKIIPTLITFLVSLLLFFIPIFSWTKDAQQKIYLSLESRTNLFQNYQNLRIFDFLETIYSLHGKIGGLLLFLTLVSSFAFFVYACFYKNKKLAILNLFSIPLVFHLLVFYPHYRDHDYTLTRTIFIITAFIFSLLLICKNKFILFLTILSLNLYVFSTESIRLNLLNRVSLEEISYLNFEENLREMSRPSDIFIFVHPDHLILHRSILQRKSWLFTDWKYSNYLRLRNLYTESLNNKLNGKVHIFAPPSLRIFHSFPIEKIQEKYYYISLSPDEFRNWYKIMEEKNFFREVVD